MIFCFLLVLLKILFHLRLKSSFVVIFQQDLEYVKELLTFDKTLYVAMSLLITKQDYMILICFEQLTD